MAMYFFRLRELKQKIQRDELTDSFAFKYYFAFVLLGAIFSGANVGNQDGSLLILIATALIQVFGVYIVYLVNGGRSGERFFTKFFPVSWVVGLRVVIPSLIIMLVAALVLLVLVVIYPAAGMESHLGLIIQAWFLFTYIVYWWRVSHHMRDLR